MASFADRLAAVRGSFADRLAAVRDGGEWTGSRGVIPKGGGDQYTDAADTLAQNVSDIPAGIGEAVKGAAHAIMHPIDTITAERDRMGVKMDAAGNAAQQGDVMGVLNRSAEAVPFAGSMVEDASNKLRTGQYGRLAGNAIGMAATGKVLDAAPKVVAAVVPKAAATVAEGARLLNPKQDLAGLADFAEKKATAVDTTTPVLNRATPAAVQPILDELIAARKRLFDETVNPNGSVTRTARHGAQPIINGLSALIKEIAAKADAQGNLPNQTLKNLHQDLNHSVGQEGFDPSIKNNPDRWTQDMHGANAVTNAVNQDAASAAANAEKSGWIKTKGQLARQSANTPPANLATTLAATLAAEALGTVAPVARTVLRIAESVYGGVSVIKAAKLVYDTMQSPAWQTASKARRADLAASLQSGNWGKATEIAAGIAKPLVVTQSRGPGHLAPQ